ncbi:MAG: multidrug efflux SMR transporter [Bacteroidales bacterium]|nr:multidrug efflux SMR transporter [Bacteroidales bacterium]
MSWFYLIIAGIFEIAWAMGMKFTGGFSRLWPTLGVLVVMGLSVYFLSLAVRTLPVGTAYAVWTGIGIAGTSILGMVWFNEPVSLVRVLLIFLILASAVGLKLLPQ